MNGKEGDSYEQILVCADTADSRKPCQRDASLSPLTKRDATDIISMNPKQLNLLCESVLSIILS